MRRFIRKSVFRKSRARRKKYVKPMSRGTRRFFVIALLSIGIPLTISTIVAYINGTDQGLDGQTFMAMFFSLLVVFITLSIVFSLPAVKGAIGEARVSSRLKKLAKRNGGYVFNNVIVPTEEGKTSQIDHVYVCSYGIFVVETKNYAGRIYGSDEQNEWTQVLAFGHTKNKLYNPVKQNRTHILRLKELLNINVEPVSIVVFVKADTDNVSSDYVYSIRELKYLLRDESTVLNDEQVKEIVAVITELKNNPAKTNKEHVKEVKQMLYDIDNNICPRCGSELVQRTGKNGIFYGCSNFPKCRFIKKSIRK